MKHFLKAVLPATLIRRVKRFIRPYMKRVGELLYEQGGRLIRKSEVRQFEKPLFREYTGDNGSVMNCCVAYNQHGGYCVPLSSFQRPAAQRILQGDVYEPETIEYIRKVCGSGDIIHAGTYFGDFIPALSISCSGKVWAFEPNPENYRCSEITISINGAENVELENAALGNSSDYVPLRVKNSSGASAGGNSSVELDSAPDAETVRTRVVRIDDIIPEERRISLLQLDVEGFEKQALSGGFETIERWTPILILEEVPPEEWMHETLLELGYEYERDLHHNTVWKA